ncbi:MAG: hypothetical protein C0508_01255 [Cyanobacteria bacterium PR.023]|jgi:murein DD-endopeptidase MepM/ murein hydrolase activator NlpD|nr:hypothetical protein [Cyanobacteria bacterium PR.3.49]MBA4073635.1 hypothetical protein [Cyanobacteria bacterium PR.023]
MPYLQKGRESLPPFDGNFISPLSFGINPAAANLASDAWQLPFMPERIQSAEPNQLSFSDIFNIEKASSDAFAPEMESALKSASNVEFSTSEMNKLAGKEPDYIVGVGGKITKNPNSRAKPGDPINIEIQNAQQVDEAQKAVIQNVLDTFRSSHPAMQQFPSSFNDIMRWLRECSQAMAEGRPLPDFPSISGGPESGLVSQSAYSASSRAPSTAGEDGGSGSGSGGGDSYSGAAGGGAGSYSTGSVADGGGTAPTAIDGLSPAISADGRVFPVDGFSDKSIGLHHGSSDGAADIFAPEGTPIRSLFDGEVVSVDSGGLGGNTITIKQADGKTAYYAHMQTLAGKEDGTPLQPGDKIKAGDVVGRVGQTGNAAGKGSHLHIGVGDSIISGSGPDGGAGSNYNLTGTLNSILQSGQVV